MGREPSGSWEGKCMRGQGTEVGKGEGQAGLLPTAAWVGRAVGSLVHLPDPLHEVGQLPWAGAQAPTLHCSGPSRGHPPVLQCPHL